VAGDGIVSELITDFFKWDNAYVFPSIDLASFLHDMSLEVDQASWCSLVLVNAICAQRCIFVEQSKYYGILNQAKYGGTIPRRMRRPDSEGAESAEHPHASGIANYVLTRTLMGRESGYWLSHSSIRNAQST
jgi:hypothetical protein